MPTELTVARSSRLMRLLIDRLRTSDYRPPEPTEPETAYTSTVLMPLLRELLADVGFPGLTAAGDGASQSARPVHAAAMPFYPDLAVTRYGVDVLAIEVKLLRGAQRQNAFATAVGQASIYHMIYRHCGILIVDVEDKIDDKRIRSVTDDLLTSTGLDLSVRRRRNNGTLAPHPAP